MATGALIIPLPDGIVLTKLTQSAGETEEQYQIRLQELIAKSKTGKSSAKRKMPESDVDFHERLFNWYNGKLVREEILFDYNTLKNVEQQIWDTAKDMLLARRFNRWTPNTHQCFAMGRCEYWPICNSNENSLVINNHYEQRQPHSELSTNECKTTVC